VLERLADDLEARENLRNKLIAASLYPAIVSAIAVIIVVFLVTYVVPQVASVFSGSQRALPLLTVIMMGISDGVRAHGWLMLGALVLLTGGVIFARRQPDLRLRMDAAWLRLPLAGRLARGYNAARFCGTLAMLASAGVPILKALQTAAETLSNQAHAGRRPRRAGAGARGCTAGLGLRQALAGDGRLAKARAAEHHDRVLDPRILLCQVGFEHLQLETDATGFPAQQELRVGEGQPVGVGLQGVAAVGVGLQLGPGVGQPLFAQVLGGFHLVSL